jgi:tRNA/rRNA methyltransferase
MLDNLAVILFKPKFAENIGATARACLNMGCSQLVVIQPQNWDMDRAASLATPKGQDVLSQIKFEPDLSSALSPFQVAYGTTARTGGWRKGILTPEQAAPQIVESIASEQKVAIVFGPEDRGLTNQEIDICGQLLTIPTAREASSLNLAQAVLIILYECLKKGLDKPFSPAGPPPSRLINHHEQEILYSNIQEVLLEIDFIKKDNLDYWMLPLRRFMNRLKLKRNEYNLLMGICRQIKWASQKDAKKIDSDT